MEQVKLFLLAVLLVGVSVMPRQGLTQAASVDFVALCYHDIVTVNSAAQQRTRPKAQAISADTLVRHFNWLAMQGYQPVSFQQIVDAHHGKAALPEKAVLLTFDDGYRSFYERVLPLLQLYNYPAVLAVTGSWLAVPEGGEVTYGERERLPRDAFLSWSQLREIRDSGLVEIASHSYDLHHGEVGNPYGNTQPAATTRIYDAATQRYEDEHSYSERLRRDLQRNNQLLEQQLGITPRVIVWPYGAYSGYSQEIAAEQGLTYSLTLDQQGLNRVRDLPKIDRLLMEEEIRDVDLAGFFTPPRKQPVVRVAHVDIDYLYDDDPQQQKRNLDLLIERIKQMQINAVYLQAFADPDGDGAADALYFPNRHLPLRADLFNRVAWQLKTRSGVSVYAWMPVLAFQLEQGRWVENRRQPGKASLQGGYQRLSPFAADNRRVINEIYQDLAQHAHFDGVLFHDDAYLTADEDSSPAAQAVVAQYFVNDTPPDPEQLTRFKTQWLIQFTHTLADTLRYWGDGDLKTARNLYARVILAPQSETRFAQNLPLFVRHYDYTAVMAMPFLEEATQPPQRWLRQLYQRTAAMTGRTDKLVFELQARDWRNNRPIPSRRLAEQMRLINQLGIHSYGYYPDDFIKGHPRLEVIKPAFSLTTHPYGQP